MHTAKYQDILRAWVDRDRLAALVHDLSAAWHADDRRAADIARIYSEVGQHVRDPRTQAVSHDVRDVRGNLHGLLHAWELRDEPQRGAPDSTNATTA